MEISFTRLRVYLECPWKYKLHFAQGQKIAATPASSLGLSLHRALESFFLGGEGGLENLLECFDRQWLSDGYPDTDAQARWREKGRRILSRYFENSSSRRTKILGVEKEFVYALGRHTVRGMIDRIDLHPDGRRELIDYKTQLKKKQVPPGGAGGDLQLRFYALGAREGLGFKPDLLTVQYLAQGREESVAYDDSGEARLKELIASCADRIEAGDFGPDTGFCPRCAFQKTCAFAAT